MTKLDKKLLKRFLSSKIVLFVVILILIFLVIGFGRESYRKYQLTKEIKALETEIEQLEGKNQQMANLMDYFKKESYLEKEARLKLNLKKPGEKVVVISGDQTQDADIDPEPTQEIINNNLDIVDSLQKKQESNFWKWWEHFFQ
ncbi:MAG: septum formation initiator family protein [Parcubacteria group bacterium]|nr:septum formation initiator family protein [Parcubacteria group bacterium]